ncbi:unnamed protein product [Peniophora sp. CBMAI 1063]|nr:unnamed protein product [Peniophora sp. CBMAI 1063]
MGPRSARSLDPYFAPAASYREFCSTMLSWSVGVAALAFIWLISPAAPQDLAIPPDWVNTTSNSTRDSREILANSAAATFLAEVNVAAGASAGLPSIRYFTSIYAVLSLQDYYSGNSSWSDTVSNGMQGYYQQYGLYGVPPLNNAPAYWGLAFFYAYRTYRQQFYLDLAMMAHNLTYNNAFVTSSAAASGTGSGRNVSFTPPPGCTNATIAGGVFFKQDQLNDTIVNAETIGPFMALSAYLYEQTNQQLYSDAAELSLNFIVNHLWNGTYVRDSFVMASCQTDNVTMNTFNQAFFVEGLSVWANVTKSTTLSSLLQTAVASTTTLKTWTLPNGVVAEDTDRDNSDADTKGVFLRGLTEARMRNPGTGLATYIDAYLTVQFNAVINNALASGTSFYTTSWSGPPVSSFSAGGNLAAVDVMNSAFSITKPSNTSTSTGGSGEVPTPSESANPNSKRSLNAGAIAGGVIGGLVAAAVILFATLLSWRRRRARAIEEGMVVDDSVAPAARPDSTTAEPFMLQTPFTPPPVKGEPTYSSHQHDPSSPATQLEATTAPGSSRTTEQETTSEPVDPGELPNLVRRLYTMLHGPQEEPPPRYEN